MVLIYGINIWLIYDYYMVNDGGLMGLMANDG